MNEKELKPAIEKVFGGKLYSYKDRDALWCFLENGPRAEIPQPPYKSNLSAALYYHALGFSVIPMGAEVISPTEVKKFPCIKEWRSYQKERATPGQIKEWWFQWPNALIGVICGKVSGIIAVDVDTPEADEEFQALLPEGLEVPTCSTPRGGKHYIFKYREGVKTFKGNFEVQSDGAIIILPPSKIPDGRAYIWMNSSL